MKKIFCLQLETNALKSCRGYLNSALIKGANILLVMQVCVWLRQLSLHMPETIFLIGEVTWQTVSRKSTILKNLFLVFKKKNYMLYKNCYPFSSKIYCS